MPILLSKAETPLGIDETKPASWQLSELFGSWMPREVQSHLRKLNVTWPLAGLEAQLARSEISKGQWVLYTATCLQGQMLNGSAEDFVFNCPGLLRDARSVTREMALPELADAYETTLRPALAILDRHAAINPWSANEDLADFWEELEDIEINEDASAQLEKIFCGSHGQPDPLSEDFAARVVSFALANRQDFCLR